MLKYRSKNLLTFKEQMSNVEKKKADIRIACGAAGPRIPGGGTWVFFGWVCVAQHSKLAPHSKNNSP